MRDNEQLNKDTWIARKEGDLIYTKKSMNGLKPGPCCKELDPNASWCNAWRCSVGRIQDEQT